MLQLTTNWREILLRAWSIRLIILAGLLSGIEVILPLFTEAIPRGIFSVISVAVGAAAFISRILVQKNLDESD